MHSLQKWRSACSIWWNVGHYITKKKATKLWGELVREWIYTIYSLVVREGMAMVLFLTFNLLFLFFFYMLLTTSIALAIRNKTLHQQLREKIITNYFYILFQLAGLMFTKHLSFLELLPYTQIFSEINWTWSNSFLRVIFTKHQCQYISHHKDSPLKALTSP